MARWRYDVKRLLLICFIFIANVGFGVLFTNDLVTEVFLKPELSKDVCASDLPPPVLSKTKTNSIENVDDEQVSPINVEEDEELKNEKNYMDTLKVVLQKVKNEVVEDNRRSSSHSEGRKSLHPPVEDGKSATAEERPNKVEKENSSKVKTKKVIQGKTKESVESSQSSSPNEYGKTLLTDPDTVLEEELVVSEGKTPEILVETETSTKEKNQKPSQDSDEGSDQGTTQQRQTGHEANEKTVGTTPQLDTLVQRPAPWTAPESPANLSDSTPTEQEVRPPVTPEEENITRLGHPDSGVSVDEKPSSTQEPANETELLSQEAEELPPQEAELPESNVTAPPAAVAEEPKLPQEVAEDAQKDQLETYSQFAERVTAEKKNGAGSTNGHTGNGQLVKGPKVKTKNYASTDCGAKFLAANPESSHSHKIINSNKDEYMLNKCTGKIWAIVELCESIRPQKFDIANFELFSNSPKDIYLLGSHRYPTREWISLGAYEGEEGNRDVQSFDVETQEFFKFIKLEVHSYYGTEFFCPLSQFKIYGLSEFEVIEDTEDVEEEDQIIEEEALDEPKVEDTKDKPGMIPNVIKSVVSGMLGVIKRGSRSGSTDEPELNTFTQSCRSLHANFSITDEMCPFAESLNYILACYYDEYLKLMEEPFVASVVQNAHFCHRLSTVVCATPKTNDSLVYDSVCNNSYACVMLSPKHVLAMCYMQDPSSLRDSVKCTSAQSDEVPPPAVPKNTSSQVGTFNMKGEKDPVDRQSSTETPPMPEQQPSTTSVKKKKTPESPPAASPVPPPDPTKEEGELNVIHLPHIDSKSGVPKEPIKKGKDSSQSPVPESMPNATVAPAPDKGTVQNVDKKERKGEKEPVEKVPISEDPQSVGGQGGGPPSTATPPSATAESRVGSHSNKESVVVRLSNKIKVLETNMSISSQYLEELSRRYKRQMEDLQRQFNITILALNKTSQTAYERDLYHQKRLEALENQLEKLAQVVSILTEEKESLLTRVVEQHMILLFVELAVMFLVFSFCLRRRRREEEVPPSPKDVRSRMEIDAKWREGPLIQAEGGSETPSFCRRRSVDSIRAAEGETKPRERRLSGHLAMTGSYKDLLIKDTTITKEKKKKKKRVHLLERSLSNASISEKSHHHSSAATKKEKKLEKLKRSSAGVLFSGEKGSKEELKTTYHHNGTAGKDINHEDWHMVRKSRSKTKRDETTSPYPEEPYVFSSDLKRGKIILDHDPVGYPHQYYAEIPFDHDPVYGRDFDIYNYSSEMESIPAITTTSESFTDVYLPDLDYSGPVVSDYYSMGEETHQQSYRSRKRHSFKNGGSHLEDVVDSSFMDVSKSPKVLAKARSCAEFRSPSGTTSSSTFKGRTKLRSDNWEWYSSQPSRLLSSCCSSVATTAVAEIISTSSSDSSSVKSKGGLFSSCDAPRMVEAAPHKLEKKKKKKVKGPKLTNGENR